jgi:putative membrane protein
MCTKRLPILFSIFSSFFMGRTAAFHVASPLRPSVAKIPCPKNAVPAFASIPLVFSKASDDDTQICQVHSDAATLESSLSLSLQNLLPPLVTAAIVCTTPELVLAADSFISPTWNSALLAYGHYFFIIVATMLLTYERVTVAPDMSVEQEKSLVLADTAYGVVGAFLAATGYFRVVSDYGKGWEYYAHEPLFWLKISAAGLLAGLSLFPTIIYIQRGSKLFQNEEIAPMSEALATRVRKVLNAELSAVLSIPLLATLMARGVGYDNGQFPWQAGAAVSVLTLVGSGALYAKQALTWEEPKPE